MFRRLISHVIRPLALLLVFLPVLAQADPRQILASVIQQLQTGTPNPGWYGPQVWGVIAAQTGNSGYYPQLASLGPVSSVNLVSSQGLPGGAIFQMVANHQYGHSAWFIGIGNLSNRIEYANFNVGNSLPSNPVPNPTPSPTPTPTPTPTPPTTGSPDDSCSLYPNLC